MKVMRNLSLSALLMATLTAASPAGADELKISKAVGDRFPDRTLPLIEGGESSLARFRGKKVILIHFASW
ncbi:MAG: hypothetical protein P1V97_01650 [Planctomycetota bacterium]|nr:hypothetical protein [Planctomycetota bacterium]